MSVSSGDRLPATNNTDTTVSHNRHPAAPGARQQAIQQPASTLFPRERAGGASATDLAHARPHPQAVSIRESGAFTESGDESRMSDVVFSDE